MSDTDKGSYNILVVSEINGAKKSMYEDGLVGLAHYIQNLPDVDRPNLFVVNGGLLPEMPVNRGGERNKDQLRMVVEGVTNIEGAAAVMKPHMERLLNALPESSEFIYVMGRADQKNIDTIKLDLSNLYLDGVRGILKDKDDDKAYPFEPKINAVDMDIESRKAIVESLKRAETDLIKRISEASDEAQAAKFKEDLKNVTQNMRLNKDELKEFEERKDLLNILNQLVLANTPREVISNKVEQAKTEMNRTNDLMKEAASGTPEYERLEKEAKRLGNRVRALMKRYNESADGETARDLLARHARIYKFTGNIPLPKNANEVIDLLAKSYYMSNLKDALGRKREVTIQESSLQVYERKLNGLEFNVVVTDGLGGTDAYKVNSNAQFLKTAFIVTRSLKEKSILDSAQLNVFIRGRNMFTSFAMDPWTDQKNTVAVALSQGPFLDVQKNTLAYLNNIRTDETRLVPRGVVDSSASIIKILADGSVLHETLKSKRLNDERARDDIKEADALKRLIAKFKEGVKVDTAAEDLGAVKAENAPLARAVIRSRRPSEVKDRELTHATEGLLRGLAPGADGRVPEEAMRLSVVEFTDVHIGNHGNLEMLKAAAKDALARRPNLLVLDGDNIEGNLRNYKYTARPENDVSIIEEYEKWLKDKGYKSAKVNAEVLGALKKLRSNAISNIDNQPKVFVDAISDLVFDVISRGGMIAIVSGNHYNKTHGDSQHDEASILAAHIEMMLDGAVKSGSKSIPADWRKQIKKGSGSDIAAETFRINGLDVEIRHGLAQDDAKVAQAMTSKRSNASLVITGHLHSIREVNNNNTEVVQGPTMQATNTDPFVKTIQVPVSPTNTFTGYLHLDIGVKDGEISELTYEPRLRSQLNVKDELFTQFLRDRRTYDIPLQGEKVSQNQKKAAVKARN